MIICPNCKEEIDDDSHYCDQCGQELLYCKRCGRVGMGRRCTYCGGLMVGADDYQQGTGSQASLSLSVSSVSVNGFTNSIPPMGADAAQQRMANELPMLTLYNNTLNIRIQGINGAVIGRRQGPYVQFFQQNMYVSGVHAQLKYNASTGWCITDKHSSNGTKLNERLLQPDVDMSLKNGDIVTIANVNLQVNIS